MSVNGFVCGFVWMEVFVHSTYEHIQSGFRFHHAGAQNTIQEVSPLSDKEEDRNVGHKSIYNSPNISYAS